MDLNDLETMRDKIRNGIETDSLDFKKELEHSKKGRSDFIKDVAAIANVGGGLLIYGVDKGSRSGVSAAELNGYDAAQLNDKIKDHLSPVPRLEVRIEEIDEKHFPILFVAGIEDSIVLTSRNLNDETGKILLRAGEIYLRQNTQSLVVSEEAVLRRLIESIVEIRVKNKTAFQEAIISKAFETIGGNLTAPTAEPLSQSINWQEIAKNHLELSRTTPSFIVGLEPPRDENIDAQIQAKAFGVVMETNSENYPLLGIFHQSCKVQAVKDGHVALSQLGQSGWREISAFNFNGAFNSQFSLIEDSVIGKPDTIQIMTSVRRFSLIVNHAFKYIDIIGSDDDWLLTVRVIGIAGRKLVRSDEVFPFPFPSPKTSLDNEFEQQIILNRQGQSKAQEIISDLAVAFFRLFNLNFDQGAIAMATEVQRQIRIQDASIWFKN